MEKEKHDKPLHAEQRTARFSKILRRLPRPGKRERYTDRLYSSPCKNHKLSTNQRQQVGPLKSSGISPRAFFIYLAISLSRMFLIRHVYFSSVSSVINGLFWSLTTLTFAAWRMEARGVSWSELELRRPMSMKTSVVATLSILGLSIGSIVAFQILNHHFQTGLASDASNESTVRKFGNLKNNWLLFFSIIPAIWLESCLEEMLVRGFLMNWIERMFSGGLFATVVAVVL